MSDRRSWHLRTNAAVLLYVAAALVALVSYPAVPVPRWLIVHLLMLGAVTNAIVTWSEHFAVTLLRAPVPSRRRSATRLVLLNIAVVGVLAGVTASARAVAITSAGVLALVVGAHLLELIRLSRRALMGRFAGTVHFYLVAGVFLIAGISLGSLLVSGRLAASHQNVHAAHVHANVFGWVGLSVVGTLFTLWPTVLRTRLVDDVMVAARRSLWFLAAGVSLAVAGLALGARWVALVGLAAYAIGVGIALTPFVRTWRRKSPRDAASWSLAAGTAWLVGCVGADIVLLLRAPDVAAYLPGLDALVPALVVGFVLQTLIGALTYLVPVIRGGGPAMMRATIEQLSFGWRLRVPAFNVGVALIASAALAHLPSAASRLGWVLVAGSVALTLGLVVTAVLPAAERLPVFAVSIGVAVIVAPAVVLVSAHSTGPGPGRITLHDAHQTESPISLVDMDIRPGVVDVPAGQPVRLVVTNRGLSPHNLVFANGPATPMLARGERATIDFGAMSAGRSGWCTVPGHRAAGMTLDLRVTTGR